MIHCALGSIGLPVSLLATNMQIEDAYFPDGAMILDVGGWFKPDPRATHVIDLMPWETRGAQLNLSRLPNERFGKDTWYQTDFLNPHFRLPFSAKEFDIIICGQTIEDLSDPGPLLREMQRVGKRGAIECPSRATEQTIGVSDRECQVPGYPHHHWIVEECSGELLLYSKQESGLGWETRTIPLAVFEELRSSGSVSDIMTFKWDGQFAFRKPPAAECKMRAQAYADALHISSSARVGDSVLRLARRLRTRLRGKKRKFPSWADIVMMSQPYSKIPLAPPR